MTAIVQTLSAELAEIRKELLEGTEYSHIREIPKKFDVQRMSSEVADIALQLIQAFKEDKKTVKIDKSTFKYSSFNEYLDGWHHLFRTNALKMVLELQNGEGVGEQHSIDKNRYMCLFNVDGKFYSLVFSIYGGYFTVRRYRVYDEIAFITLFIYCDKNGLTPFAAPKELCEASGMNPELIEKILGVKSFTDDD